MKAGYRELIISRAVSSDGGMSLSFENCCVGLELPNSFFEKQGVALDRLKIGQKVNIKGTLGNEDVMLATLNPLEAFELAE